MATLYDDIAEAARAVRAHRRGNPVAVLVGPAFGGIGTVDRLPETENGYRLACGSVAGCPVVMPADPAEPDATFAVRVAAALGARALVVAPNVWGLHPAMRPGDWVLFTDHINASGANPLTGLDDPRLGPSFLDMGTAYDGALRGKAEAAAREMGVSVHRGVYIATTGRVPGTDDDRRALRALGADAAGIGGAAEAIVAVQAGLAVLGFAPVAWDARGNGAAREPSAIERCIGAVVSRI